MPRATFEHRAYSDEEIKDITRQLMEELDVLKKELGDGLDNNKAAQKRARKLTLSVANPPPDRGPSPDRSSRLSPL